LKRIVEDERVRREEKGFLLEAGLLMGKYEMEIGRYKEAVSIFRDLSKDFQENGLIHFCLGEALFFTRDFPAAVEELERAQRFSLEAGFFPVNLGRLNYFRHYRLGQCYMEVGQIEQARHFLLKSISLHQDHRRSLQTLGQLSLKSGRFEEAVTYYEKAVEKGGGSDQTFANLGFAYGKLGKEAEGERALRKALEINPQRVEALINLGHLYHKRKGFPTAVDFFQKALLLDPDLTDVRLSLSEIYFQLCEIENLVAQCEALRKGLSLSCQSTVNGFKDLAKLYEEVAEVLLRNGRDEVSLKAFHVAFLLLPSEKILERILSLAASLRTLDHSLAKVKKTLILRGHKDQLQRQGCPDPLGTSLEG
jgi:tetratricopeptide (TPR) repeat protein